jgi:hypothetical protein
MRRTFKCLSLERDVMSRGPECSVFCLWCLCACARVCAFMCGCVCHDACQVEMRGGDRWCVHCVRPLDGSGLLCDPSRVYSLDLQQLLLPLRPPQEHAPAGIAGRQCKTSWVVGASPKRIHGWYGREVVWVAEWDCRH